MKRDGGLFLSRVVRRIGIGAATLALLMTITVVVAAGLFWWRLEASRPRLQGQVRAPGLTAPVRIDRDTAGVPTITGASRGDLAYATGYLHAQERFFQMDELRRAAAGELGELFGPAALKLDEQARPHRFRDRARILLAHMSEPERHMLGAYVAGVNRGLADLHAAPFEYMLLRKAPEPWRAEDSLLVVYAMYLDLEGSAPTFELDRARAAARVGPAMADLLFPTGTELDSPIDGSRPIPVALPRGMTRSTGAPAHPAQVIEPPMVKGSNNWAVAGRLTATGAAMVANDMHLHTAMPNSWYRLRLVVRPAPGVPALDIAGVTLPGIFPMVIGSNGHVAWGFTDSYIDLHDAVIVDPVAGRPGWYRSPTGPQRLHTIDQRLCAGRTCHDRLVLETIWGPIVGRMPDGRAVADRWIAHDLNAIRLEPMLSLERARTTAEAVAAAHRAALPDENFIVGDSAGHIAWTIIGRVPRRFGFDGRDAASWSDGRRGWAGYRSPSEVPTIIDPPSGRLWTANGRVVGGAMLAKLGDGGYDDGARAREIARRLFARDRFTERDLLAIQLDTTALRGRFWQAELLRALARHRGNARLASMLPYARDWNGRAETGSVGYRLIRSFRAAVIADAYRAYTGKPGDATSSSYGAGGAEGALRTLLRVRPPALVPPGYADWTAFVDAALGGVADQVDRQAHGRLAEFNWGRWMHADIHHPLAKAIPLLGFLTDPADQPMPGDSGTPRAQYRGGGASERLVVSPGHEAEGLFHMPGGEAGDPLAPYYLAGHKAWVEGDPTPLRPGRPRWTLMLVPATSLRP